MAVRHAIAREQKCLSDHHCRVLSLMTHCHNLRRKWPLRYPPGHNMDNDTKSYRGNKHCLSSTICQTTLCEKAAGHRGKNNKTGDCLYKAVKHLVNRLYAQDVTLLRRSYYKQDLLRGPPSEADYTPGLHRTVNTHHKTLVKFPPFNNIIICK